MLVADEVAVGAFDVGSRDDDRCSQDLAALQANARDPAAFDLDALDVGASAQSPAVAAHDLREAGGQDLAAAARERGGGEATDA